VINVTQLQVKTLIFYAKPFNAYPLNQNVIGDGRIEFLYLDKVPYISRIGYHYSYSGVEYWNEYNFLIQRFGHFIFTSKDYYSMFWFEMLPFVEYNDKAWNIPEIIPDPDYSTISSQLQNPGSMLEEQFSFHSGHWWISDYYKMLPVGYNSVDYEKQVQLARDLITRLKRFF